MNLLQRAQAGLWLSPFERTIVRIYQSIEPSLVTAIAATLVQIAQSQSISLSTALSMLGGAAFGVAYSGARKYLSASSDPTSLALGQAIGAVGAAFQARIGQSTPDPLPVVPVVPASDPTTAPAVDAPVDAPAPAEGASQPVEPIAVAAPASA